MNNAHTFAGMRPQQLHDHCTTFPPLPDCEIQRDQHLETFMRVFSGPVELLVLEGDEGTGKTTLLSQFARQYPERVISSFVPPVQRYGYDAGALQQDFSAQILSILDPRRSFSPRDGRDGVLQSLIHALRRHAKHPYYFLLDGLTEIPDDFVRAEVASLLPIGHGFPVIVSGEANLLPPVLKNNQRMKMTQTVNFSLAEVEQYFSDVDISESNVRQIYQESGKGVPAHLASVRRCLLAGLDFDRLRGKDTKELFEQEWEAVVTDEVTEKIVAVVAHSRHRLTVRSLSQVLDLEDRAVSARIDGIPFLQLDRTGIYAGFVSRTVADLAAETLVEAKGTVVDMIVKHILEREPDAADTVPNYLQESGRLEEVISFLSPEHFSKAVNESESFAPIKKQLQIGIESAVQLGQDSELMRFGLESSAIMEIEGSPVSRHEIEALMTTNQVSEAVSLAARCPLREDRLHLLGVIARCGKEQGTPVEDEILDQIRQLHGQIDPKSLGDRAIDIAAELFPCVPDLAISLIEQGSRADGDENELDIAYVRLSIATAVRQSTPTGDRDDLATIRNRIRNPRLRGFTTALTSRIQSAAEVIAEADSFEAASDKLYVLRRWAIEHSSREDATDVVEYGLRTIVEATAYAPNVRVLRELSTPLRHTKDPAKAQSLVRNFDGQRTTVDDQGPTEEVVRLQLNLAAAECLYDEKACANRLVEVYLSVHELTDLSTKSSCLARLLSTLQAVDSSGRIEEQEDLASLAYGELDEAMSELLDHTAEQFYVTHRIIDSLATLDGDRSFTLASSLNTAPRREDALLLAIDAVLESDSDGIDLKSIRAACNSLRKSESRDRVAASVAEYLARQGTRGQTSLVKSGFETFQEFFFSVSDPMMRCQVLCLIHGLAEKGLYTASEEENLDIPRRIREALEELDPGWSRIDGGLRVARSFVDWDPTLAKQYLSDAEGERTRNALASFSSEWAYQACLRLSIRAFAGQLGEGYDPKDDIARLGRLIDRLPSTSLRAQLWGELAMQLFLRQHTDGGNSVVTKHVLPLIDSIGDASVKSSTIVAVSPALYRNHKNTALSLFDALEDYQRDKALMTCAEFMLERHIPSDPYEAHDTGYDIRFQEAVDIVELAGELRRDNLVYALIVALADTLSASRSSSRFTRQQKADLVRMIEDLIDHKFPDQDNIRHDGFAIASEAQLLRFERHRRQSWTDVIKRAKSIPNKSDRAYVLAIVGQALPAREANQREPVFEEAIQVTETIPCTYDRLARLNDLADMMARKSQRLARRCLRNAIEGFQEAADAPVSRVFRNMVDTAFKIDPEFAASLVSVVDDDPARAVARHEMKRRLGTLRSKEAMIEGAGTFNQSEPENRDLPRSAWLALGSLNAGRVNAVRLEHLRLAVRAAGRLPLRDAFPILAWVIENAVRRFSGSTQSRSAIRVIFEGAIHAAELAEIAAANASVTVRHGIPSIIAPATDESIVVRCGERDRAVEFIKIWLEQAASRQVYICDQYFGPTDLDLVMLVQSVIPNVEVAVLTSRRHQEEKEFLPLHETYKTQWQRISAQKPPRVEIVAVGFKGSGKSPIHDRSILTEKGGISMGTSWNSIGLSQDSTVRVLSKTEASQLFEHVGTFLLERRPDYAGKRLLYEPVTL